MTDIAALRAFVRGKWEASDNEIRKYSEKKEPHNFVVPQNAPFVFTMTNADINEENDYWYNRGIRDLAEMMLTKLAEE